MKAKVVLLGEGAVGKTSLVLRYVDDKFNDKHEQTLQVSGRRTGSCCYPSVLESHVRARVCVCVFVALAI